MIFKGDFFVVVNMEVKGQLLSSKDTFKMSASGL